jgi:hypothetical protein
MIAGTPERLTTSKHPVGYAAKVFAAAAAANGTGDAFAS